MDERDLRSLFDGYMECFNRLDGPEAAFYYSAPSFVVKNGGVTRFAPEEKVDYFSSLITANAAEGEHRWEIVDFEATRPSAVAAIVTVRWVGRRPRRGHLGLQGHLLPR